MSSMNNQTDHYYNFNNHQQQLAQLQSRTNCQNSAANTFFLDYSNTNLVQPSAPLQYTILKEEALSLNENEKKKTQA